MDTRTRRRISDAEYAKTLAVNDLDLARKQFGKLKTQLWKIAAELEVFDDAVIDDKEMQHTFVRINAALRQQNFLLRDVIKDKNEAETMLRAKSEELDRVWYMLRTITGDSTLRRDLKEQADHHESHNPQVHSEPTPFNKPQY